MEKVTDKRIAETILHQLGGRCFIAMTGAYQFFTNGNDCVFRISGKNSSKANCIQIVYDKASDTYIMRFIKISGGWFDSKKMIYHEVKKETLKEYTDVYSDMLQDIFTAETHMYTHL